MLVSDNKNVTNLTYFVVYCLQNGCSGFNFFYMFMLKVSWIKVADNENVVLCQEEQQKKIKEIKEIWLTYLQLLYIFFDLSDILQKRVLVKKILANMLFLQIIRIPTLQCLNVDLIYFTVRTFFFLILKLPVNPANLRSSQVKTNTEDYLQLLLG